MIYKEATPERRMIMRNKMQILLLLLVAFLVFPGLTLGSDMFIYPNKGQSQKQQDKDKYDCYGWAKQHSNKTVYRCYIPYFQSLPFVSDTNVFAYQTNL